MSALVLPTSPLHRTIGVDHWVNGLTQFTGVKSILVAKQAIGFQSYWTFTIEKVENEIYCVTRLNGKTMSLRRAADLPK